MAIIYGKTYWGKKWLEAFNGIDMDNRLPRGRTYANKGLVTAIDINQNHIKASVQGSWLYDVEITLKVFNQKDQQIIYDKVRSSPFILSGLMNKKLPASLFDQLELDEIHLFPSSWRDIKASCSCPDWAVPCKHIAAVLYQICAEIDKNPFMIFYLHGCDLLKGIDTFKEKTVPLIEERSFKEIVHNPDRLEDITFSQIPDLLSTIYSILPPDPPFYAKDFREILYRFYRDNKRERYIFQTKLKTIQPLNDQTDPRELVGFLQQPLNFYKRPYKDRFLKSLFQFVLKLMSCSAFIPEIFQNKKNETFIYWKPALFDANVKTVFDAFCEAYPPGLFEPVSTGSVLTGPVSIEPVSSEEGVLKLFDKMIEGFIFTPVERDPVHFLFFHHKSQVFKDFTTKEIPSSIYQWLSRLHLTPHKLYLMVTENKKDGFDLELKVSEKLLPLNQITEDLLPDLALIEDYIPKLAVTGSVSFELEDFSTLFVKILPVLKAIGIMVILPKSLEKILRPKLTLKLQSKEALDRRSFLTLETLVDFDWKIALGDQQVTLTEFKKILQESKGLVKLASDYVLFDEKEMAKLLVRLDKLPETLSQADILQASLAGELDEANVMMDAALEKLWRYDSPEISIPGNLEATLRPYQERGFRWLAQNMEIGFGSILADDMGLGKTLQVITLILHLKNQDLLGPVLIVAPTGLLSNWEREIQRFAPSLTVGVYHGVKRGINFDIVITSYGLAKKGIQKEWFMLVIDEAQNIKNPKTAQTKAIKSIKANHKIALSGTPVENRLLDYWSLFDFTNKGYLGTPKDFKERYAAAIERDRDKEALERFKKVTIPFMLRRTKTDKTIIQDLPDKVENNRYCSLTKEQAGLYQEIVTKSLKAIEKSEGIERKGLVLQMINALKQICNHPAQYTKKNGTIDQSGKLAMLQEILDGIGEEGEKSLIFTQYVTMGNLIQTLMGKHVPFLHGGLSRTAREKIIKEFQERETETLIVSLKAGGTGLNLTAANHVIHYDLWWNPAVENQATDRAYRIGQTKKVIVHRFLTTGTFEEKINDMIQSKKDLANLTVGDGESWVTEMSQEELRDLVELRNG